jgi:hypothetical protein
VLRKGIEVSRRHAGLNCLTKLLQCPADDQTCFPHLHDLLSILVLDHAGLAPVT